MSIRRKIECVDILSTAAEPEEIISNVDVEIISEEDPFQSDDDDSNGLETITSNGNKSADADHKNDILINCQFCSKSFKKQYINIHLRLHGDEKLQYKYKCNICSKTFKRDEHRRRHQIIHSGKKTHICDMCNKQFSRSDHLLKHKRIHTREQMFDCKLCDKRFSRSDHLAKHMKSRTHSDDYIEETTKAAVDSKIEKQKSTAENVVIETDSKYYCDVCKKSFRRKDNIVKHQKSLQHLRNTIKTKNKIIPDEIVEFMNTSV